VANAVQVPFPAGLRFPKDMRYLWSAIERRRRHIEERSRQAPLGAANLACRLFIVCALQDSKRIDLRSCHRLIVWQLEPGNWKEASKLSASKAVELGQFEAKFGGGGHRLPQFFSLETIRGFRSPHTSGAPKECRHLWSSCRLLDRICRKRVQGMRPWRMHPPANLQW
jgi:hypothetical protein